MISKFSYMEPPEGLVISKLNPSYPGRRKSKYLIEQKVTLITVNKQKFVLDTVNSAQEFLGKKLSGTSYYAFREKGFFMFNSGDFIFKNEKDIPVEFRSLLNGI